MMRVSPSLYECLLLYLMRVSPSLYDENVYMMRVSPFVSDESVSFLARCSFSVSDVSWTRLMDGLICLRTGDRLTKAL